MDSQRTPKKFESCDIGSSSISEIVRYSLNEKFRKKCFQVLQVSSTQALEKVVNQKLRAICSGENKSEMKKVLITSDKIVLSDSEDSLTPPQKPVDWLFSSTEKHKNLKRRASASLLFDEEDKENTPVKFFSQPARTYQSAGKLTQMQFNTLSQFTYKSPSERYLENALKNHGNRDRTQDVPEKTRKTLFFDDKPVTNLF